MIIGPTISNNNNYLTTDISLDKSSSIRSLTRYNTDLTPTILTPNTPTDVSISYSNLTKAVFTSRVFKYDISGNVVGQVFNSIKYNDAMSIQPGPGNDILINTGSNIYRYSSITSPFTSDSTVTATPFISAALTPITLNPTWSGNNHCPYVLSLSFDDNINGLNANNVNMFLNFSLINGLHVKIDRGASKPINPLIRIYKTNYVKELGFDFSDRDYIEMPDTTTSIQGSIVAQSSLPYNIINRYAALNIATPPQQCRDMSLPKGVKFDIGIYIRASPEQDYDDYNRSGKDVLFINGSYIKL